MPNRAPEGNEASANGKEKSSNRNKPARIEGSAHAAANSSGHDDVREAESRLLSYAKEIQCLADLTKCLETSSFSSSLNAVVATRHVELKLNGKIMQLESTVEQITRLKTEEIAKVQSENEKLAAGREASTRAQQEYESLAAQLKTDAARTEAKWKQHFEAKYEKQKKALDAERLAVQDEAKKLKVDIENENAAKLRELGEEIERLSTEKERLNSTLQEERREQRREKRRHGRDQDTLEHQIKELASQNQKIKGEFAVEEQPWQS